MTEQSGATKKERELKEREVADYLHRHPDFFSRHEYLLEEITIPHAGSGNAVSLIERQVGVMREQKLHLRKQLHQLTLAAKTNEELLRRFQGLILNLIDSDNLDQAIVYIRDSLQEGFHADAVELVLFDCPSRPENVSRDDKRLQPLQRLLQERYPVCGHFSPEQRELLFGSGGEEIASAVIVPLCGEEGEPCIGLLGIGSIDPKRYHPDMGTVFVGHLGAVINRIFSSHLDK
ncbi:MAG: DUF484 family protein [Pseudomonadota bacterium]